MEPLIVFPDMGQAIMNETVIASIPRALAQLQ